MAALKRAMRWDEERYGREYDLDRFMIFCADDFNLGAMENKGLNIFNSRLVLADAATATDGDYQAIEGVIGHEYFHNWTGNRVTCRDWFQLSLKEGLTVFRDQEFSADMGSRAVERIAAVDYLRSAQFAEDASPLAHPVRPDEYVEINNFYTATVYEKGAEVIRMQHTLLGPARFRRGMDLYFERHDGQAVTCDDFVQAMEDASVGVRRARSQAVPPLVQPGRNAGRARFAGRHDAARRHLHARARAAHRTDARTARQGAVPHSARRRPRRPRTGPTSRCGSPVTTAADGTTRVLSLTAETQAFVFVDVRRAARAVAPARIFGAGAARVRLHGCGAGLPRRARQRCLSTAGTPRSAASADAILALAAAHARGEPHGACRHRSRGLPRRSSPTIAADPALLALALTPPEAAYLAGLVDTIDVDALVGGARIRRARARKRAAASARADVCAASAARAVCADAGADRSRGCCATCACAIWWRSTTRRRARSPSRSTTRPTT